MDQKKLPSEQISEEADRLFHTNEIAHAIENDEGEGIARMWCMISATLAFLDRDATEPGQVVDWSDEEEKTPNA